MRFEKWPVEGERRQRHGEGSVVTPRKTPYPQRRQADEQRHQHPGAGAGEEGEEEVGAGLADQVAGHGGAEAGDGELPEADLAAQPVSTTSETATMA